ncbi:MAG: DUF2066 domain-containing protein [Gammaproteobacteria bacterium]|nr:DUF2066 domain-containing protein [Gammaproteobacteria bacterium]
MVYCNPAMLPACARLRSSAVVLLLCALTNGPARPDTVTLPDFYAATVPASGVDERARQAAFRAALADVLVRATGQRDAAQLESLAPMVADAARYVVSFWRATGNRLAVSFDGRAIENAIDAAGLPFWGAERPVVLVWLALDRGGGQYAIVNAGSPGEERQRVAEVAARRGLPLVWPVPGEDSALAAQAIASGEHTALLEAAGRHGADGVLVGRVAAGNSAARPVEWTFTGAGTHAAVHGVLETGPDLAADRYAGLLASSTAGRRSEEYVTVTGIDSIEAFAGVERALGRLRPVREVRLYEVAPDAATFRVEVRGDPQALVAALQRDAHLQVIDSARLVFALTP